MVVVVRGDNYCCTTVVPFPIRATNRPRCSLRATTGYFDLRICGLVVGKSRLGQLFKGVSVGGIDGVGLFVYSDISAAMETTDTVSTGSMENLLDW